jgi:hypothetical protein
MRIPSIVTAAVAAAAAISSSSAHATMRLANDPGGLIAAYQHRFDRARTAGEHIIIDGSCLSACTLAIGLVPMENVCATSKAVLGFHAAWQPTPYGGRAVSVPATQHMMNIYPTELQGWIKSHGGLTPHMIFLKGEELNSIVPACGAAEIATAEQLAHQRPSHHAAPVRFARGRHHHIYARPIFVR